jgi:hypothetical protein
MLKCIVIAAGLIVGAAALAGPSALAAEAVPPGNRHVEQPQIPAGSSSRTRALKTTYEAKYRRVVGLLQRDEQLRVKIREVSGQFDIDPIHVVGAIVGEHTYNVDAYDRLQTYYVKAAAYLGSSFDFAYGGESIDEFIQRPQFERCSGMTGSYDQWTCRAAVWDAVFRGKTVDDRAFPDNRFSAVFFQPFYAGQTFGIGQMNPLTALAMSDVVKERTGLPPLDHRDPQQVYQAIMDPDRTLAYVAATLRKSIDAYRRIAGFDISGNPGITATLYNVGDPEGRARALKAENAARASRGEARRLPEENYYGWLVNDKLDELRGLFPPA